MRKWRFNGMEVDVNPTTFSVRPTKNVAYRTTIDGKEVRVLPLRNHIETYLEVSWSRISEEWKNRFHDWNIADREITLQTHLLDPRDIWTVVIDEMQTTYLQSYKPAWEVTLSLRVVDGVNDPILRRDYDSLPFLFVVENDTNRVIHDARIFIESIGKKSDHALLSTEAFRACSPDLLIVDSLTQELLSDEELELLSYDDGDFLTVQPDWQTYGLFGVGTFGQSVYGGLNAEESYPQLLLQFDMGNYQDISEVFLHIKGNGVSPNVANGYSIERKSGDGEWESVIGIDSLDVTEWSDEGPFEDGKDYVYRVQRVIDGESSGQTNLSDISYSGPTEEAFVLGKNQAISGIEVYFYDHVGAQFDHILTSYANRPFSIEVLSKYLGDKFTVLLKTKSISSLIDMTQLVIDSALLTLSAMQKGICSPSITQTYLNVLRNPSFESGFADWAFRRDDWSLDYIRFSDGAVCVATKQLDSPIYQAAYFPEGEHLTAMCVGMGEEGTSLRMSVDYLSKAGVVLESASGLYELTNQHEVYWFTTYSPSPVGTSKARFRVEKAGGEGSIYVDQAMIRLGKSSDEPEWTAHEHDTLAYDGEVNDGDVLRINLLERSVDINGEESVYDKVVGDFFTIPIGRSMLIVNEDALTTTSRIVLRYDELWD